ncbi:TPA: ead/Ea22-like family protein [Salmonella enterica subsp. enterica]|nr:ead/Ea22-like family protein [Salmonella enterica subsp. enterica]HCZ2452892.1 ead/Ea22-like family protein [Salmonella enterica subsp. enterica]
MNIDKQALREEFRFMQVHYSDPADRARQVIYIAAEALLDDLETKEEQRANWFQMAQKLGEDLDAAEKRNAEQREYYEGVIADGSKRIAEQSAIVAAAEKLVRCKGRYHSELNYRALAKLFGVITPDLPPLEHENVHYADAAEVEITALRQRIAELERSEMQLINERDSAESALNDAYKAVMGQAPEWSNWFSFESAIDEIELACELWRNQTDDVIQLRQRIQELEAKLETADRLQDGAFRDGLKAGFSYGQTDDQSGFTQCLSAYSTHAGIGVRQQEDSDDSDVGSRNQPGMVVAIHIDAGDFVKVKGQVFEVEETDFDDHDVTLWFVGGNALKCSAGCPVEVVSGPVADDIKVQGE